MVIITGHDTAHQDTSHYRINGRRRNISNCVLQYYDCDYYSLWDLRLLCVYTLCMCLGCRLC